MFWHETDYLGTTNGGVLYHLAFGEHVRLGDVEDCEDAAGDLGLGAEYAEHLDQWRDAKSCDYAGQVHSDYRSQQGV